jgi:hypothetical protein
VLAAGSVLLALATACAPPPQPPRTTFTAAVGRLTNAADGRFFVGWEDPPLDGALPKLNARAYPAGTKARFSGSAFWGISALVGPGGGSTPQVRSNSDSDWLICTRIVDRLTGTVLAGSEACSPITAPVATAFPWSTVGTLPGTGTLQLAPQFMLVPAATSGIAPCIGIAVLLCTPIYVDTDRSYSLDTAGAATNPNPRPAPTMQPPYVEVPIGQSVTVTTSSDCPSWRVSGWSYYSGLGGAGPPVTLSDETLHSVTVTASWQARAVMVSCMSGSAFVDRLMVTVRPA